MFSVAKALLVLRDQVDKMYPHRDKSNDGTIGDTRHQATHSDHNPNSAGVVCAMDITHDPASGCDSYLLAEEFRRAKDKRVQYIISNKKIANADIQNWAWRPYGGTNPHDHHVHISIRQEAKFWEDGSAWDIGQANLPDVTAAHPKAHTVLRNGSKGDEVARVQYLLGILDDGIFGDLTEEAVKVFQKAHGLVDDGVVGGYTWKIFDTMSEPWIPGSVVVADNVVKPPVVPIAPTSSSPIAQHHWYDDFVKHVHDFFTARPDIPVADIPTTIQIPKLLAPLDLNQKIMALAATSPVANYDWKDRGKAPVGYVKGMALTYARARRRLLANSPIGQAMAKQVVNNPFDALFWYQAQFAAKAMTNASSQDILRHLFVLMFGLGMRESSGQFCEGRDTSASNVSADTAEAGLFQMSWNAHEASPYIQTLFNEYNSSDGPNGYQTVFAEGVKMNPVGMKNYGSGPGADFQKLCKASPAFAVEAAAVGLRVLRTHWGPIVRHDAELVIEVDKLLKEVDKLVV